MANGAKVGGGGGASRGGGGPSDPGRWGGAPFASEAQVSYMSDLRARSKGGQVSIETWQSLGGQTALREAIQEKHPNASREEISALRNKARDRILGDADRYIENLDLSKVNKGEASRMISYLKRGRSGRIEALVWSKSKAKVYGREARPDPYEMEDFMRSYAK